MAMPSEENQTSGRTALLMQQQAKGNDMPTVTNEMVYAAMKEAVQRGLLPKGGRRCV
jgi:hypothetical protein